MKDYRFESERGPVGFADLFGDKQTLVIYSYMFGQQRERRVRCARWRLAG